MTPASRPLSGQAAFRALTAACFVVVAWYVVPMFVEEAVARLGSGLALVEYYILITVLSSATALTTLLVLVRNGWQAPRERLRLVAPSIALTGWAALGVIVVGDWLFTPALTEKLAGLPTPPERWLDEIVVQASPVGVVGLIISIGLLGPISEELAFRGVLLRPFVRMRKSGLGVILTSAFFAAIHVYPVTMSGAFVLGLLAGFTTVRSSSIWPAVAMHAAFNTSIILWVAFNPEEALTYKRTPEPELLQSLLIGAALIGTGLVAFILSIRKPAS